MEFQLSCTGRFSRWATARTRGQKRDDETGNDYFGARWLSVDPVPADIYDPQRLNRYSYVLNDPVNYVDPDGTDPTPGNIGTAGPLHGHVAIEQPPVFNRRAIVSTWAGVLSAYLKIRSVGNKY
ncbi:MAG: RHS repeat-associated core domain-containing protein [Acidobacteriota bacterium]